MDRKLILAGLAVAIIIAIMAPFIASSNPDGLDSTIEGFEESGDISQEKSQAMEEGSGYSAPLPDYIFPPLGESGISGSIAIVIGVLIVFLVVIGLGQFITKKE